MKFKLLIGAFAAAALAAGAAQAADNFTGKDASGNPVTLRSKDVGAGVQAPTHTVADTTGAMIDPATAGKQDTGNASLSSIDSKASSTNTKLDTLHADAGANGGKLDTLHSDAASTNTKLDALLSKGGIFFAGTTTPLGSSATYTGTARDVGVAASTAQPYAYFNAFFLADQAGTATIECSNDNTTWYTCATSALTASTPLILTVPVMFRYLRAKLVNGASAQGSLVINNSFTAG